MATGLIGELDSNGKPVTIDHPEWPLYFCNVQKAWKLTPPATGKREGEGIVIAHTDTGYTKHPELIGTDGRYKIGLAKSFLKFVRQWPHSRWPTKENWSPLYLPPIPSTVSTPEDSLTQTTVGQVTFHSHGTSTASTLMSSKNHPNKEVKVSSSGRETIVAKNPIPFPKYKSTKYVTGFAPKAEVIPYKVSLSVMLYDEDDEALARAIRESIQQQVAVISISLASVNDSPQAPAINLKKAIADATKKGIIICCAVGAHPEKAWLSSVVSRPVEYPACDRNTIAVSACDANHAPYTLHTGKETDITAPGKHIWRAHSKKGKSSTIFTVTPSNGNSYATTFVAGACALWQAFHGRSHLISTYGAEYMTSLFRYALIDSAGIRGPQTKIPVKGYSRNSEGRTSVVTELRDWDKNKYGAGILDVEALLKWKLPTQRELSMVHKLLQQYKYK